MQIDLLVGLHVWQGSLHTIQLDDDSDDGGAHDVQVVELELH